MKRIDCGVRPEPRTKKEEKAAYDRVYRKKNLARLTEQRADYFQRTYDPQKAAVARRKKMPQHIEYCRQPQYRVYKSDYDRKRKLSRYGAFAEAYEVLEMLKKEIRKQMPDRFERYAQAKRHQWNPLVQQRRRNGNPVDAIDSY